MTATKKVTDKNTKKQILDVLADTQAELRAEKSKSGVNKRADLKVVQEQEVVEKVKAASVEETIKNFRVELNKGLAGFEQKLLEKQEEFENIQEAIDIQKTSLKDIHEISQEADTLDALLRAQEKQEEEFNNSMNETRLVWGKEQQDHAKELQEKEAELRKTRTREQEEYSYDQKLKIKKDKDTYEAEKAVREKALKDQEQIVLADLKIREDALIAKEEEVAALKATADKFEEVKLAAVEEAVESALGREKSSRHFEVSALKKDQESSAKILDHENKILTDRVAELTAQNTDLNSKLQNSYAEIRQVSEAAITGAAQSKVYVTNESSKTGK